MTVSIGTVGVHRIERGVPYVIGEPGRPTRWRCYVLPDLYDLDSDRYRYQFVDAITGETVELSLEGMARALVAEFDRRHVVDFESMAEYVPAWSDPVAARARGLL